MKNLIQFILIIVLAQLSANAQTAKMTSVYTNLKTDCAAETKTESDEVPFICKAVGKYRARIVPAGAWAESIEIVDADGEQIASLGTHGYGYSVSGNRLIEWRMANGKPFAVIFRVNNFNAEQSSDNGDSPYLEKYKIGESLIVRGLSGYSRIEFDIDGKEPNANKKARNLADTNFQ